MSALDSIREHIGRIIDVQSAINLLHWDQEVYMPPKGAPARGRQLATLSGIAHRLLTEPAFGDSLRRLAGDPSLSGDERSLVAETLYDHTRATDLPEDFVERFALEQSRAYEAWTRARNDADFAQFLPHLKTIIRLNREKADLHGYEGSPYNALLEDYERGMTVEQLQPLFNDLAERQSQLVHRIIDASHQPAPAWLDQTWDAGQQWDFTLLVLRDIGYDFGAGRQDKSVHPFTTEFDLYDVRVTTRIHEDDLFSALTSSLHEGGHALYEQGFRETDRRTTLAAAPSLGIHESQSRMWENMIGRSRPFWVHYAPAFRNRFDSQLKNIDADDIYHAINRVQPSLIRVEADECTYNLHIVLRFEIELALIEGTLDPEDAPEAWNAAVKRYLGLEVPDDAHGCLQDIHWSHGSFGYFPTYALGNLYAAQLFERIEHDLDDLWEHVTRGDFAPLLQWLRANVHQIGRRKTAVEIVRDATGAEPSARPFLDYLNRKYGALYGLDERVR